jgi:hypothetical protein
VSARLQPIEGKAACHCPRACERAGPSHPDVSSPRLRPFPSDSEHFSPGRSPNVRLLDESFAHPPLVLAQENAAELREPIGRIVEHADDRLPVLDLEGDDLALCVLSGLKRFSGHVEAGVAEQAGELEHLRVGHRNPREHHPSERTPVRVPASVAGFRPATRSGLQHHNRRDSRHDLLDFPNPALLRYDIAALQNLGGRVELKVAVWKSELDGLDLHSGSLGPLPVPAENKPDFTRLRLNEKCTEPVAPSSGFPTDLRRSACLSESLQPRKLRARCGRDLRTSTSTLPTISSASAIAPQKPGRECSRPSASSSMDVAPMPISNWRRHLPSTARWVRLATSGRASSFSPRAHGVFGATPVG